MHPETHPEMHPDDRLPDYVLGWLSLAEQTETEAHLARCQRCQSEVRALREGLLQLTETLPLEVPAPQLWERIQKQIASDNSAIGMANTNAPEAPGATRPLAAEPGPSPLAFTAQRQPSAQPAAQLSWAYRQGWWPSLGLAASLVLLVFSLGWGIRAERQRQQLNATQATLASWLSDSTVGVKYLREVGQPVRATALVRIDGSALVVMPGAPPEGQAFQIWGIKQNAQNQKTVESIGLTQDRFVQVSWQGYQALWVSVEPAGGSPQPTRTIGRARLI